MTSMHKIWPEPDTRHRLTNAARLRLLRLAAWVALPILVGAMLLAVDAAATSAEGR